MKAPNVSTSKQVRNPFQVDMEIFVAALKALDEASIAMKKENF